MFRGRKNARKIKLNKLSKGIKKIAKADKLLSTISTTQMPSELDKLLEYAFTNKIIKGTEDVIALTKANPNFKDVIAKKYDEYIASISNNVTDGNLEFLDESEFPDIPEYDDYDLPDFPGNDDYDV